MKKAAFILLALLLAGCSTVSRSWTDFRAYYNRLYNAQQEFRAGEDALQQDFDRFTDPWIQLFPERRAGQEEPFEKAIAKTGELLRNFPDSRWTGEAQFLRARSLYYLGRPYRALQSFDELASDMESAYRQKAVIWKGRVLYEMNRDSLQTAYLQGELGRLAVTEDRNYRAEAKALLAQTHARNGRLNESRTMLEEATSELPPGDLRARTHFLFGQVLEERGSWVEAYYAYTNVSQGYPEPIYLFLSAVKKSDMARKMGNTEESADILRELLRDDKFYGYRHHIVLEQAKTEEAKGNHEQAERTYLNLLQTLRSNTAGGVPGIRADTYYRLGSLYVRQQSDYLKAAAYFDSASGLSPSAFSNILNPDRDSLAATPYRDYAGMRHRMQRMDSLLWLGSLPALEREKLLEEERNRRLEALRENQMRQSDRLYGAPHRNADPGSGNWALFGFLNHRNPSMRQEARNQFRAYWGERPLQDNWRTQGGSDSGYGESPPVPEEPYTEEQESASEVIDLNLEAIPLTPEAQDRMRNRLAELSLQLGHHFRFSLAMPDSAATYYRRAAERYPESPVAKVGLFSLEQLYLAQGDSALAREILREGRDRYGAAYERSADHQTSISLEDSLRRTARSLLRDTLRTTGEAALKLRQMAKDHSQASIAPELYMRAIELHAEEARTRENEGPADTGRSARYAGTHWDRVRAALEDFLSEFGEHELAGRAEALLDELQIDTGEAAARDFRTCEETDSELVIREGLDAFMEHLRIPESLQGMRLEGTISYRFRVDRQGVPLSWELQGSTTGLGLEDVLTREFPAHLRFLPVHVQGEAANIQCTYHFPISLR
ncbi:MAG: hypothetical protein U5K31_04185 [Balneolaceae bacterium]|nr:hypothetical protein [Balneolaceae bacterium]